MSIYADDIAIFISEPEQSVLHILETINRFSKISGHTINWQKSNLISINAELDPEFVTSTQFKTSKIIIYLGIKMTRNPKLLSKIILRKF